MEIAVADLAGDQLAEFANGRITLDNDAAGHGWFIDSTPGDDLEFAGNGGVLLASRGSAAAGRIDALSVLAHEMGHALGLGHADDGVMDEALAPGTRTTPERWHGAAAKSIAIDWGQAMADSTPTASTTAQGSLDTSVASRLAAGKAWQQRFVNELARPADSANPNGAMRVFVPASASLGVALKPRMAAL